MSSYTAIVLAAGRGSRMKSDMQKQYMSLQGKPILYYSLKAFEDSFVIVISIEPSEPLIQSFFRREQRIIILVRSRLEGKFGNIRRRCIIQLPHRDQLIVKVHYKRFINR